VDGVLRKVELADIQYVEGMKDYVMFHLASARQPLVTHLTMKAAEDMLPADRFMRIHRSYIVNLSQIASVTPQADVKVGDALLHVSEGYRPAFDAYLSSLS
jgi:DNA-binding LytR/AlgR family response regulator